MTDSEINHYAKTIYEIFLDNQQNSRYPEWLLQELDNNWMIEIPTSKEIFIYTPNKEYINYLLNSLGDGSGEILERLSDYLLSIIPGFRTNRCGQTHSTDYDIVCNVEGVNLDFRAELGRYFICECKDQIDPADFTTIAKFCRVLDSVKSKSGILFSLKGISGTGKTKYAEREQIKVYQDRGMVILVVDHADLEKIAKGSNFIVMLRNKYEQVRLDLLKRRENPDD